MIISFSFVFTVNRLVQALYHCPSLSSIRLVVIPNFFSLSLHWSARFYQKARMFAMPHIPLLMTNTRWNFKGSSLGQNELLHISLVFCRFYSIRPLLILILLTGRLFRLYSYIFVASSDYHHLEHFFDRSSAQSDPFPSKAFLCNFLEAKVACSRCS